MYPGAGVRIAATFPDGGFILNGGGTPGVDFEAGPVTDAPSAHYAFVARYDSNGGLVWQRKWASPWGANVVVAGDGSAFAFGRGVTDVSVAGLSGVSNSWIRATSPYVLKLGPDGAFAWAEAIPSGTEIGIVTTDSTGHAIGIGSSGMSSSIGGESIVKFGR